MAPSPYDLSCWWVVKHNNHKQFDSVLDRILEFLFKKKTADDNKSNKNNPSCKELYMHVLLSSESKQIYFDPSLYLLPYSVCTSSDRIPTEIH